MHYYRRVSAAGPGESYGQPADTSDWHNPPAFAEPSPRSAGGFFDFRNKSNIN
jgi:hypothetical protein